LRSRQVLLATLGLGLLAVGGWYVTSWLFPGEQTPPVSFDLPPLSASDFLNTSAEAKYVGIKVCAGCHAGKHRTWQYTPHSKALGDLDPSTEPPDTHFVHAA